LRLFGRRETLNEQLLREAGAAGEPAGATTPAPEPPSPFPGPPAAAPWRGGPVPPRVEDVIATVEAHLRGDAIRFVALPDGSLLVEEQEGEDDLSALAAAVERDVRPPYRARARRHEHDVWAVGATAIDVRALPGLPGDEITATAAETLVDGKPHAPLAPLTGLGGDVVHAERLDGDWWELEVSEL
jgi:hypothetical protein